MTDYTVNDIKVLEKDTTSDPKSFSPRFELPGEIYNQSYPKRLRHSFPESDKWHETVEIHGETVERWKKYVYNHYLDL